MSPVARDEKLVGVHSVGSYDRGGIEGQKYRIVECMRRMREMEDKATHHFNAFLRRKAEITEDVEREYQANKRAHLGSTKEHVIDTRIGKDETASSHAGNNKWYISQATMYATMASVEMEALRQGIFPPR